MPVLPSYRNQSIDLHNLAGFYMRVTLAFNGSILEAKSGDDPKLGEVLSFLDSLLG